ncbi:TerB N-terminal domain-containing protein [Rhizobium laguerreae]|uniref:TerB N-terminal domain-containing protein n=1 Tax=Rhizobium laguerreae TaxID=1076926 RepID=UPI001C908928|nr:TerB N-terminal domain-containing protein [Rhizobium laguerreae]MBY3201332.1 hypothetical protein [Rhizobium laguerreae]
MNFRILLSVATMSVALLSHSAVFAEENSRSPREVQQALADAGFSPGKPDGMWGKKSINALKAFQKSRGLPQSGVIDDRVLKQLFPLDEVMKQLKNRTPPKIEESKSERQSTPTSQRPAQPSDVEVQTAPIAVESDFIQAQVPSTRQPQQEADVATPIAEATIEGVKGTDVTAESGNASRTGYVVIASILAVGALLFRKSRKRRARISVAVGSDTARQPLPPSLSSLRPIVSEPIRSVSSPPKLDVTQIETSPPIASPQQPKLDVVLDVGQVPFGTRRTQGLAASAVTVQNVGQLAAVNTGWLASGMSTTVGSISIAGGLIYVGGFLPKSGARHENENCLINPKLSVGRNGDPTGATMGYWPSYSNITPEARRSYLEWLAGPRSDPNTYIGYVFLYFYGLERRLMLETDAVDAAVVADEVRRLIDVYGHSNSFRRYATELLAAYEVATHFPDANWIPEVSENGYEVPTSIKVALGMRVKDGRPIEPELLLKYVLSHPETSVRTPARRAPILLKELFTEEIGRLHPEGLKIGGGRFKAIATSYRACSGSFTTDVKAMGGALPDITGRAEPITTARAIFDACSDKLDGYSRALGRSSEAAPSLAAVAKLPERQRRVVADGLKGRPLAKLDDLSTGFELVSVRELISQLGLDGSSPVGKGKLREAAQLLAAFGFGYTADPAFSLSTHKADDALIVFKIDDASAIESEPIASGAFRALQMSTMLGMIIGHADGEFDDVERNALADRIASATNISSTDRTRLMAEMKVHEKEPHRLDEWTKRLKDLQEGAREGIADLLVDIATADGSLHASEVKKLEVLFKRMNVDEKSLYRRLHERRSSRSSDDDTPEMVIAPEIGPAAIPIPPRPSDNVTTRIDVARLVSIRNETRLTASVLTEIFADEEEELSDAFAPVDPGFIDEHDMFDGLERRYGALLTELRNSDVWTAADFDNLVRQAGLMPGAALEAINNWALDRYDELLIEGGDPIYISNHLITENVGIDLSPAASAIDRSEGMPA